MTEGSVPKAAPRRRRAVKPEIVAETAGADTARAETGAESKERAESSASSAPTSADRTPGLPARRRRASAGSDVAGDASEGQASEKERDQAKAALELAHRIVDLAADRKAADIVLLSVAELTTLTDYFVICSGGSERQLGAIADGIVEGTKAEGTRPIGREGAANAHWLLIDYGSVIVHVMAWPERDFYALEKLWSEAPLLLRVQ